MDPMSSGLHFTLMFEKVLGHLCCDVANGAKPPLASQIVGGMVSQNVAIANDYAKLVDESVR